MANEGTEEDRRNEIRTEKGERVWGAGGGNHEWRLVIERGVVGREEAGG